MMDGLEPGGLNVTASGDTKDSPEIVAVARSKRKHDHRTQSFHSSREYHDPDVLVHSWHVRAAIGNRKTGCKRS